ncbi:uncharacterized protein [Ptychodera flava]|uniref:uncharacterized protein n=1 Tax=Ptychodera flava TaxID=63121 RepID=UPI00396A7464
MSVYAVFHRKKKVYLSVCCLLLVYTFLCNIAWYYAMSEIWNSDEMKKLLLRELRRTKGVLYTSSIEENPVEYFSKQEQRTSSHTDLKESFEEKRTKYLVPILLGNQGPNNQLQSLKLSAVIASYRDRTIVRAPFFEHHTDNNYFVIRNFNETLDVRLFSKLLPTAGMEEFYRDCDGRIDAVFNGANWSNGVSDTDYRRTVKYANDKMKDWARLTNLKVPNMLREPDKVINLPDDIPDGYNPLRKVIDSTEVFKSEIKCVGFVYPYGMLGRFYYHDYVPVLSGYVTRSPEIRRMAGRVIRNLLDRRRYLGFHWRYNEEWKRQWCFRNTPKEVKKCRKLNTTEADTIVDAVQNIMDVYNLEVVYLATPLDVNDKLVAELIRKLPNLYTREDLFDLSRSEVRALKQDNYKLSLLEQELCTRSTVFLGSRMSSWSSMVDEDRNHRDVKYVPDVFLQK